ncbi:MAG: hypothetical protein RR075_04405, partial [Pygmaiobacter sp.]
RAFASKQDEDFRLETKRRLSLINKAKAFASKQDKDFSLETRQRFSLRNKARAIAYKQRGIRGSCHGFLFVYAISV